MSTPCGKISFFLKHRGFSVVFESDGRGVLPALLDLSAGGHFRPGAPRNRWSGHRGIAEGASAELAIIMLRRSGPGDRLLGWRESDAYLVKPVEFKELDGVIRRKRAGPEGAARPPGVWIVPSFAQASRAPKCHGNGHSVGVPYVRKQANASGLASVFGGSEATASNRLPAALSRLRKKLEGLGEARLIVAVRGEGYRFWAPSFGADPLLEPSSLRRPLHPLR